MIQSATLEKERNTVSLDALYALIHSDLERVNAFMAQRIQSEIPLISEIAGHIIASGGKRIRPALTLISAKLCQYEGDRQVAVAAAIEFIHTATLLHDDVVDASTLRRGMKTANALFGNKASVLVGDFLLGQAFQIMVGDGSLKALKVLADAAAIISQGEVMQLMTEGRPETAVDTYLQVISAKTAALFAAACELGPIIAGRDEWENALREFGVYIGMAFQLVDDALDYAADREKLGKNTGDDFQEGKITLPVILAYNAGNQEEKRFWTRALAEMHQTEEDFPEALRLMRRHRAIEQTIAMAERYADKARQCLSEFPPSQAKSAMLELADFCTGRVF